MRADEKQVGGDHYKKLKVTPWEYMESVLTHEEFVGYLKGNIIKYLSRKKNGIEDFHKAAHYVQKLDEVLQQKPVVNTRGTEEKTTKTPVYGPLPTIPPVSTGGGWSDQPKSSGFPADISTQLEGINWDAIQTARIRGG